MARQARSEVTRRKIINAAVDLFSERGYGATGLGDIIDRVEMTKGALYYHFDSKESLASAIIDEGIASVVKTFDSIATSPAPALENMIHGTFVVTSLVRADKAARTGAQLSRELAEFADAASRTYRGYLAAMSAQAHRARTQGDLRADLDPDLIAEVITSTLLGAELISNATTGGSDLTDRLTRSWEVLLPAVATEESLPYFGEFLAREAMRNGALTVT